MDTSNSVTLIGRVSAEPRKAFKDGHVVFNFQVAVNSKYTKKDNAEFFKVAFWVKNEAFEKYLSMGQELLIQGGLKQNRYPSKAGYMISETVVKADSIRVFSLSKKSKAFKAQAMEDTEDAFEEETEAAEGQVS